MYIWLQVQMMLQPSLGSSPSRRAFQLHVSVWDPAQTFGPARRSTSALRSLQRSLTCLLPGAELQVGEDVVYCRVAGSNPAQGNLLEKNIIFIF